LRHASLQAEIPDRFTNIHSARVNNVKKSWLHSNQKGTFWQVEIPEPLFGA